MAKRKRKTLPKDFQDLLREGDLNILKAVFNTCEINAYERYSKEPALAFTFCSDELTRWLVEQGADTMARDIYNQTPLHIRASDPSANIQILLELGADVNAYSRSRGTPLHRTASRAILHHAKALVASGADVNKTDGDGNTPLAWTLDICQNSEVVETVPYVEFLLENGARKTPEMKGYVTRIGHSFEFHRSNFNLKYVEQTSDALHRLYEIFEVEPVPRRKLHDDKSPIVSGAGSANDRHYELWQLLVPSSGAASTVQGEVIRISGKVYRELAFDGGVNWGNDFRKMVKAFLVHIRSGEQLPPQVCIEADAVIGTIEAGYGDAEEFLEMAVDWVALNPMPVKLPPPDYSL